MILLGMCGPAMFDGPPVRRAATLRRTMAMKQNVFAAPRFAGLMFTLVAAALGCSPAEDAPRARPSVAVAGSTGGSNVGGSSGSGTGRGTQGAGSTATTGRAGAGDSTPGASGRGAAANGGAGVGRGPGATGAGGSAGSVTAGTGVAAGSGAPPSPGVGCPRPVGVCSAPQVSVTNVDVGMPVVGYGREGDTDPIPLALAALPGGGSRLAWLGTDSHVHVAELDCSDKLVGTPVSFPGIDLQDLHADDDGGVVLLTRPATNAGTDNCGNGQLCGGTSSPCRTMWLVRFDRTGNLSWETQVTNLSSSLAGYDNGARFVWWYQHQGRIAFDGSNYAAYFCIGITVNNGSCVDIHEGDRMQVVSGSGALVKGHADAFEVGCSHSWNTRIVWDPRTQHFVTVCATDNSCRIARPNPYRTVATGTCDGTLFGGDLVLASTSGYWTAWSQGGQIRLEHFTTAASDQTIGNAGSSSHPHLVAYGTSRMLLSWGLGSGMAAQIRDAGNGDAIGSQFMIGVPDHDFMGWKPYPDGSVAYAASGTSNTSIRIARVMACN